jgi:hypothetical protein
VALIRRIPALKDQLTPLFKRNAASRAYQLEVYRAAVPGGSLSGAEAPGVISAAIKQAIDRRSAPERYDAYREIILEAP